MHHGEINHGGTQDPLVSAITDAGIITDCSGIVPANARGAIVQVIICRPSGDGSAHFVSADSVGNLASYGISNYSKIWGGGLAFCPFYDVKNSSGNQVPTSVQPTHGLAASVTLSAGSEMHENQSSGALWSVQEGWFLLRRV
jgi:hypothetical protein